MEINEELKKIMKQRESLDIELTKIKANLSEFSVGITNESNGALIGLFKADDRGLLVIESFEERVVIPFDWLPKLSELIDKITKAKK